MVLYTVVLLGGFRLENVKRLNDSALWVRYVSLKNKK